MNSKEEKRFRCSLCFCDSAEKPLVKSIAYGKDILICVSCLKKTGEERIPAMFD